MCSDIHSEWIKHWMFWRETYICIVKTTNVSTFPFIYFDLQIPDIYILCACVIYSCGSFAWLWHKTEEPSFHPREAQTFQHPQTFCCAQSRVKKSRTLRSNIRLDGVKVDFEGKRISLSLKVLKTEQQIEGRTDGGGKKKSLWWMLMNSIRCLSPAKTGSDTKVKRQRRHAPSHPIASAHVTRPLMKTPPRLKERRLCSSCVDGKHARQQLTSDLLLGSQIASVLIQSGPGAAALHSLVSPVQLLPQLYWKQGGFWFTDTGDIISSQMNVCISHNSADGLLLSLLYKYI